MGGRSTSSNSTTQNAYDNRTFIDDRDTTNIDRRVYNTVDARQDNRQFVDARQDNSVRNSNNTTNIIDDRDDNRTFIDESIGDGAVVARDGGSVTITEIDGGAVQASLEFAEASQLAAFGAVASILDKQQAQNSTFLQAVYANSEAGDDESRNRLVYASLFAGVSLAALIAFRKGF